MGIGPAANFAGRRDHEKAADHPGANSLSSSFNEQLSEALGTNYTLHRELAGGGMSRVFVATEHGLERSVVVKVLRPDLAEGINRERFRREVMLAAQLQHPLIVPVLNAGQQGSLLWYTMPFVEGESIRESIKRDGPSSGRDALRVLHDVLDALAYAHSRGVIHRDIKPGNILRHGNHSLVTDFGVAKALTAALPHATGMTSAGMVIGTPAYMAPEQLAGDPKADHRLDLYAVGLLAYELLTGVQAFSESSPQATMAAQLTRMPRDLQLARPDVDPQLAQLVMHLLAKSPDERPQTAQAAIEELEKVATGSGTVVAPARRVAPKRSRFAPLAFATVAVIAAVVLWRGYSATQSANAQAQAKAHADSLRLDSLRVAEDARRREDASRRDSIARVNGRRDSLRRDSLRRAQAARDSAGRGDNPQSVSVNTQGAGARSTGGRSARGRGASTTDARTSATAAEAALRANRRVAVFPVRMSTTRDNLLAAGPAIQDSLRRSIAALGYALVSDAELLQLISQNSLQAQRRLADALHIGAFVTTELAPRGDEVIAQATVIDVWRNAPLSYRQLADLEKPLDVLVITRDIGRSLDRISWRSRNDPHSVMLFDVDNMTGVDSLARMTSLLTDSLRAGIQRASATVVPLDSTLRATRDVTARQQIAVRRGVGLIVTGSVSRLRADSLLARLAMRDMSEDRLLPPIELRFSAADAGAAIAKLVEQFQARLAQVNWGPKTVP